MAVTAQAGVFSFGAQTGKGTLASTFTDIGHPISTWPQCQMID